MFLVFLKFLGWLRYNWVGSQMVKTVPSIFIYALKLLPHRSPFLNYQTGHASGTPHLSRRGRGECCWVDDVEQDPSFWMPHISSARQLLHSQFTWRFCRSFLVLSSRHWRSSSVSRIVGFMGGGGKHNWHLFSLYTWEVFFCVFDEFFCSLYPRTENTPFLGSCTALFGALKIRHTRSCDHADQCLDSAIVT